ncbi:MAG: hypothetical protein WBP29_14785 [Candidatus Zixiibacteriota bacterium]
MSLTRLSTIALFFVALTASAFGQFEKEAGKIVFKNALMPYPAGNDKIAFVRPDDKIPGTPFELFLGEIATGKETRLLPGVDFSKKPTFAFAFSPNGTEFVVPTKGGAGAWELMKYSVGSQTGAQIGDLAQFKEVPRPEALTGLNIDPTSLVEISDITWSPSGKKLVFTMVRPDNTAVWWMDIASGRARQATEDKTGYWGSMHPNDELICYTDNIIYEGISTNEAILLRSITTGDIDTLCNSLDEESAGVISPDGKYLAYTRKIKDSNNIWVLNLASRESRALTTVSGGSKHCAYPRWTPDGKRIVFQGNGFIPQPVALIRDFATF